MVTEDLLVVYCSESDGSMEINPEYVYNKHLVVSLLLEKKVGIIFSLYHTERLDGDVPVAQVRR